MFPSPYGVSFILIIQNWNDDFFYMEFPSPYGVSFILISHTTSKHRNLFLSFRLLTEYHSFLSSFIVSISNALFRFRLLTEYHSFLL